MGFKPFNVVLSGVTGAGKTHLASEFFKFVKLPVYYCTCDSDTWFDGYKTGDCVLYDEFQCDMKM